MFAKIALATQLLFGSASETPQEITPLFPYVSSGQVESLLNRTMRFFFNEYSIYPAHLIHEKWRMIPLELQDRMRDLCQKPPHSQYPVLFTVQQATRIPALITCGVNPVSFSNERETALLTMLKDGRVKEAIELLWILIERAEYCYKLLAILDGSASIKEVKTHCKEQLKQQYMTEYQPHTNVFSKEMKRMLKQEFKLNNSKIGLAPLHTFKDASDTVILLKNSLTKCMEATFGICCAQDMYGVIPYQRACWLKNKALVSLFKKIKELHASCCKNSKMNFPKDFLFRLEELKEYIPKEKNNECYKKVIGLTPLHMVNSIEEIDIVLKNDSSLVRSCTIENETPFHYLIKKEKVPLALYLLEHWSNSFEYDQPDLYGMTPLAHAVLIRSKKLVEALLAKDVCVNYVHKNNYNKKFQINTPLFVALRTSFKEAWPLLLEKFKEEKNKYRVDDDNLLNLICLAIEKNATGVFDSLDSEPNSNKKYNELAEYVFLKAVGVGKIMIVEELLKKYPLIALERDGIDHTPLMFILLNPLSVSVKNKLINLLLKYNADITVTTNPNQTLIEFAQEHNVDAKVVDHLKKKLESIEK